jgi:hypothetical protein
LGNLKDVKLGITGFGERNCLSQMINSRMMSESERVFLSPMLLVLFAQKVLRKSLSSYFMKDYHNIGTIIGIVLLLIGFVLEYFWFENNNTLLFIYILAIIFLFIQPIIEIYLYFQNKYKK